MAPTKRNLSLRQVQQLYDRLRLRYFMDAPEDLNVPPPAAELRWGWIPENIGALGETCFDEDGDAEMMRIAHYDRSRSVIRGTLLHELTHIRLGPKVACGSGVGRHGLRTAAENGAWRREAIRLATLGALQL